MSNELEKRDNQQDADDDGGDAEVPSLPRKDFQASETQNRDKQAQAAKELAQKTKQIVWAILLWFWNKVIKNVSFWMTLSTIAIAVATGMYTHYARKQWSAMDRQLSIYTSAQLPFVFLEDMPQETEELGNDSLVRWSQIWHNSGGSKPNGLKIWGDCPDAESTVTLDFIHHRVSPESIVLGPQTKRTLGGCESSYNHIKQLDDENLARARAQDKVRHNMYVFGGADYADFLGNHHIVEYCYQLWWDNRSIKFGFRLIQCLPPNDGHNCTDEECKDRNPKQNPN